MQKYATTPSEAGMYLAYDDAVDKWVVGCLEFVEGARPRFTILDHCGFSGRLHAFPNEWIDDDWIDVNDDPAFGISEFIPSEWRRIEMTAAEPFIVRKLEADNEA